MKVELIRTDGTRELHNINVKGSSARIAECNRLGGFATADTINLRDGRVMIVDDLGWEVEEVRDGNRITLKPIRPRKPINAEATKLYHSICKPGTTHQIVGDVVIAKDEDFAL